MQSTVFAVTFCVSVCLSNVEYFVFRHSSQRASVMPWDFGGESKPPLLLDHGSDVVKTQAPKTKTQTFKTKTLRLKTETKTHDKN